MISQADMTIIEAPPLSNLLLDFLNREGREIFGLFSVLSDEDHIKFLAETINVAVFICYEFCIENPGSVAECDLVRIAFKRRERFVDERLIRYPIREASLDELWNKKEREYRLFREPYGALYSTVGKKFIAKYSHALIHRSSNISTEIVTRWDSGPISNKIWNKIKEKVAPNKIDEIRKLPQKLKENGLAIKGQTLVDEIGPTIGIDPRYFRHVLQNHFFGIYLDEYDLRLLSQIPYFRTRYGFWDNDLCYNYEAIRASLSVISLWNLIRSISADTLVEIRKRPGYFLFRDTFHFIASHCSTVNDILRVFSFGADQIQGELNESKLIEVYDKQRIIPVNGFRLTLPEISAIDYRLKSIVKPAMDAYHDFFCNSSKCRIQSVERLMMIRGAELADQDYKERPIIAIFVALQVERKLLVNRWSLKCKYPNKFWTGTVQNNNLIVYGTDQLGRVPAAIATMDMIYELRSRFNKLPEIIISTGIAGGFKKEGVMLGNIIIAESVADLAMRKIRDEAKNIKQEFRPRQFAIDSRIGSYVKSGSFDLEQWERSVIRNAEWPEGLRPTIKYGPVASMDEVVSSEEWVKKLCDAWPKLLGIEMEAGGVCAASDHFGKKVCVIRGVSDYADPLKSDDEWRRRAMKTIAHLLENIDYDTLLQ